MPQLSPKTNRRENGNSILEFSIIAPFMVTALLGTIGVGFTLGRAIQINQVTRDSGHMFFDGVDFSQTANQKIIGRLSYGMGLASDPVGTINTSGNGVVILTQIIQVGATECANGGYSSVGSCPNYNDLVIEKRIVIGNSSLLNSAYGTPSAGLITSDGSITPNDYCTSSSAVVTTGSRASNLNLVGGQYTYVVEAYFVTPTLSGFWSNSAYSYVMM